MAEQRMNRLRVGGKEYPCRVTMGAMVRFKNESGKDVSELRQNDIGDLMLFIYCCVKSASHADGESFDMDFETFADHLDPESVNTFYEAAQPQKKTKAPEAAR